MKELHGEDIVEVVGGDNPGMGSYDGKGDKSVYLEGWDCGWTDNGKVRCILVPAPAPPQPR